jgi:hypothetical protein
LIDLGPIRPQAQPYYHKGNKYPHHKTLIDIILIILKANIFDDKRENKRIGGGI